MRTILFRLIPNRSIITLKAANMITNSEEEEKQAIGQAKVIPGKINGSTCDRVNEMNDNFSPNETDEIKCIESQNNAASSDPVEARIVTEASEADGHVKRRLQELEARLKRAALAEVVVPVQEKRICNLPRCVVVGFAALIIAVAIAIALAFGVDRSNTTRIVVAPSPTAAPKPLTALESYVVQSIKKGATITSLTASDLSSTMMLRGPIPTEIGSLTQLTFLHLSGGMTGTIPTEIFSLRRLKKLYFYNNSLTGTIPTEFGLLANLVELALFSNSLAGLIPSEVGHLSSLTYLALNRNLLTGTIPTELGRLSNLHSVWIDNNYLTGSLEGIFCRNVISVSFLAADCAAVNCSCCTLCCPNAKKGC